MESSTEVCNGKKGQMISRGRRATTSDAAKTENEEQQENQESGRTIGIHGAFRITATDEEEIVEE